MFNLWLNASIFLKPNIMALLLFPLQCLCHQSLQENNVTHTQTNESEVQDGDHHLKSSSKYTEDRRSSVVDNVKEEINDIHKSNK